MKSVPTLRCIGSLGRFPPSPWFHSIRKYGDMPSPSSEPSKVTSPTKFVPILRRFYEASVQDGFQGSFEEFNRRKHFHAYERAVKLGRFQGTYDAWRFEVARRRPGNCAYISTLHLNKVVETGQYASISLHQSCMCLARPVLVNDQAVGKAIVTINHKYKAPPGTLLSMYYDPEKHLLRFQTQHGEPLPSYTDIDLISKARSRGYQPLLVLALSEGLISTVPDGYLASFDLQANIKSGYYIRAKRSNNGSLPIYNATVSFPSALGSTNIKFRLSEPGRFEYLRFFPYIHEDQTFRFWDVERGVDAPLKKGEYAGPWDPPYVKKRFPGIFEHAKRLGYWKEF